MCTPTHNPLFSPRHTHTARQQAAHQEALDTALKHERELQQLPALKRQLEALKHHATETELEMRYVCICMCGIVD